jgi:hypothetical protein
MQDMWGVATYSNKYMRELLLKVSNWDAKII